ncbi:MAG: hypothetical protein ABSA16_15520 [Thermoguttaceae bacterium]
MAEETPVPNQILCPYCKRLITLPAITLGSKEKCPHCDIEFVVSSRLFPPQVSDNSDDPTEGYGLQTKLPLEAAEPTLLSQANALEQDAEIAGKKASWRPMETPSLGLFFKGTFIFPFSAGPRGWLLILLMLCIAVSGSASLAIYFGNFPSNTIFSADKWFASAMLSALTIMLGLFGLFLSSSVCLTIMRDTAEGMDKFKDQHLGWFTDWVGETAYLAANLFWGALPAVILIFLLPVRFDMRPPIYLFSETFLFPICLMSSLECKSSVTPYSKAVWKSLFYAWHAWALFYLLTLLIGELIVYLMRVIPFGDIRAELLFISVVLPFLLVVYFRLLGRLAWFCSGRFEEDARIRGSEP